MSLSDAILRDMCARLEEMSFWHGQFSDAVDNGLSPRARLQHCGRMVCTCTLQQLVLDCPFGMSLVNTGGVAPSFNSLSHLTESFHDDAGPRNRNWQPHCSVATTFTGTAARTSVRV